MQELETVSYTHLDVYKRQAYDRDGKGLSIMDVVTSGDVNTRRRITGEILKGENCPNHEAIDFYDYSKEDIRLFAEMGFKCFRTSIAWTRISQMVMKNSRMKPD